MNIAQTVETIRMEATADERKAIGLALLEVSHEQPEGANFFDVAQAHAKTHGITLAAAVEQCSELYPDLHAMYSRNPLAFPKEG